MTTVNPDGSAAGGLHPTDPRLDEPVRPTLITIPDGMVMPVDNAPGATVDVDTESALTAAHNAGRLYIAGKAITIAGGLGATARPCLRIFNPADSSTLVYILALTLYTDVTQQIRYTEDATLGGTPTALTPTSLNRALATPPAAKSVVQWSDTAPSGGTPWPNESRIFNTSPLPLRFPKPIPLRPNKAFVIDFQSAAAQITTANVYFLEIPLA